MKSQIIDCDALPFVPERWEVAEHIKAGLMEWSPPQLYLSEKQNDSRGIGGHALRDELASKPVLNANVLDFLMKNRHLIPEKWKEETGGYTTYIFFWGTIYHFPDITNTGISDSNLCVRCLYWRNGWSWTIYFLDRGFYDHDPAALRAGASTATL